MHKILSKSILGVVLIISWCQVGYAYETEISTSQFLCLRLSESNPISGFLLRFDLPTGIDSSTQIDLAILELNIDIDSNANAGPLRVVVAPVTKDWTASSFPYTDMNFPTADSLSVVEFSKGGLGKAISHDVTEVLRAWVHGRLPNFGFACTIYNEIDTMLRPSSNSSSANARLKIYYSRREE